MPNIKSAIKRAEVTKKKNLRNRMIKSNLNTTVKKLEKAVAQGDSAQVETLYREAVSAYDRAGAKGALHRNAVNRKKAQMAKIISAAN